MERFGGAAISVGDESLLTPTQVTQKLGLKIKTLRDLVYRKKIPYTKVGGSLRFSPKLLNRWIEASTFTPGFMR